MFIVRVQTLLTNHDIHIWLWLMVGQSSLLEEEEIYHHSPQLQQMKQSQKNK